jgi:hypothetical protein
MTKSILKKATGFESNTLYASEVQLIDAAVSTYASLASTLVPNGAPPTIEPATFADKESFAAMKRAYRRMLAHLDNRPFVFHHTANLKEGDENDPVFWAYEIITQWLHVCAKKAEKRTLAPESRKHEREEGEAKKVVVSFNKIERVRPFLKEEWQLGEEAIFTTRCYSNISPCSQALRSLLVNTTSTPATVNTQGKEAVNRFLGTKPSKELLQSVMDELCTVRRRIVSTGKFTIRPNMLLMDRRNLAMLFETDILLRRVMVQLA